MDIARKVRTRLTNETASLTVAPEAIARQFGLSFSDPQAGRSLDAFLESPLGRKSMEKT